MADCRAPVAVFDSGLGGISVLRELVRTLPMENYLYFGDSLHAPYGTKTPEEVTALSLRRRKSFWLGREGARGRVQHGEPALPSGRCAKRIRRLPSSARSLPSSPRRSVIRAAEF